MDFLTEKGISKGFQHLLGYKIWNQLSKHRRLALIELVQQYAVLLMPSSLGLGSEPTGQVIEFYAKARLKDIERQEVLSILSGKFEDFPDLDILDYQFNKNIFERLSKRMQDLIDGLKKIKFPYPDMEKRRKQIINAMELRVSIPIDEYDLWVINHAVPGSLSPEDTKKIDDWLKTRDEVK